MNKEQSIIAANITPQDVRVMRDLIDFSAAAGAFRDPSRYSLIGGVRDKLNGICQELGLNPPPPAPAQPTEEGPTGE